MSSPTATERTLDAICNALPAGEERPGQKEMANAIRAAIQQEGHVVVQAGTGTGKSLAYLVPAAVSGRKTVISTATKALQDQLATKDLPLLAEHCDRPLTWSVLKGRSNYLCLQRLDEATAAGGQQTLGGVAEASGATDLVTPRHLRLMQEFAAASETGDRAELDEEPQPWVWAAVSVGPNECPGAAKCPRGDDCFAERARSQAAAADIIVVNTHLYGLHLRNNQAILPPHDVVVFDEAHEVEDIISATTGISMGPGSFTNLARVIDTLILDVELIDHLHADAKRFAAALEPHLGSRFRRGLPPDLAEMLSQMRERVNQASNAVRQINDSGSPDLITRKARVATAVGALVIECDQLIGFDDSSVMWVSGTQDAPRIEMAPLDIGVTLDQLFWNPEPLGVEIAVTGSATSDQGPAFGSPTTAVFTSATIPPGLATRLQIPTEKLVELDVGTPFDFENNALLYCATHLPEPRSNTFLEASAEEIHRLILAARGRTLALFTSYRAMNDAADRLVELLPYRLLRQGDLPKMALIEAFTEEPETCLFATMGYWAGIDVPGPSLSLVTIDKLPFPRPDEPLMAARRERAGAAGFTTVDLPRTATLLAQGAGRLIRTSTDRGVVAVLDKRLATANSYRWTLIKALPPMRRTKDFEETKAFLESIAVQD